MDGQPYRTLHNQRTESRPGFYHGRVAGLSVALIVIGVFCAASGITALVLSLVNCHDHPCEFYRTYISPGIWSGLMFIATGIIGLYSAKRKTTCFIICTMAMSVVTAWIAVVCIVIGIMANFDHRWHGYYPIGLHVANSLVAFFALIAFVLSWIKFGYACHAVCCNGLTGYPKIQEHTQYQSLPTQPAMYPSGQPPVNDQGHAGMVHSQPAETAASTANVQTLEPIYLVQGHRIIGVLPLNSQQQMLGTTAPGAKDATGLEV